MTQHRGKTSASTSTTPLSIEDQLIQAEVAVLKARDGTAQLHAWWKRHLFAMSMLVLLLSFQAAQKPSAACIANIKSVNTEIVQYRGWDAAWLVINDSVVEIMGLIMVGLLAHVLSLQNDERSIFVHPSYMLATLLVPLQVATFFANKTMGCAHILGDVSEPLQRTFPVSLIFHVIVTVCCYFMIYQMKYRNKDIESVKELKRQLREAEASNKMSTSSNKKKRS